MTARDREAESRAKAEDKLGTTETARQQLAAAQARTKEALAAAEEAKTKLAAALEGEKQARGQADKDRTAAEVARKAAEDARAPLAAAKAALEAQSYGTTVELAHQAAQDRNFGPARQLLAQTPARFRGWEWGYVDRLTSTDRIVLPGGGMMFSPSGKLVLALVKDRNVIWDADPWRRRIELPPGRVAWGLPFTPDGSKVVSHAAGTVFVTELAAGGKERSFPLPADLGVTDKSVVTLYVLPDGQRVVAHVGKRLAVLNLATGGRVATAADLEKRPINRFAYAPKGNVLFTTSDAAGTDDAQVWDAAKLTLRFEIKGAAVKTKVRASQSATLSPDGSRLAWPAKNPAGLKLYDTATGKEGAFVPAPPGGRQGAPSSARTGRSSCRAATRPRCGTPAPARSGANWTS